MFPASTTSQPTTANVSANGSARTRNGQRLVQLHHKGVHFIGLNNCQQVDAMGKLGADQLSWLKATWPRFRLRRPS
jgi:3',5'-cyclic AMP phosphodiesterase CpdA